MGKQSHEYRFSKDDEDFAKFLDDLYRNYHSNLDRLGFTGILKMAQVIIAHPKEVIEELKKYARY